VRSTCTGYSDGPFDQDAVSIGRTFAPYAAVAQANAALYSSTSELAQQLQQALQSPL
jgi:GAF domain-containing protein